MGAFRHNPETGEREYVGDDALAEQAPPPPRDNFVQNFLSGPLEIVPPPPRPRAPSGRPYRRAYPRRRG